LLQSRPSESEKDERWMRFSVHRVVDCRELVRSMQRIFERGDYFSQVTILNTD